MLQTKCQECNAGTFQPDVGASACGSAAGKHSNASGMTTCISCPENTFSAEGIHWSGLRSWVSHVQQGCQLITEGSKASAIFVLLVVYQAREKIA